MFLINKRIIGMAVEAPAYAEHGETLTSANFTERCRDIKYTPEIAEFVRKYATRDFAKHASVMGKRDITIGFTMDMAWGGTSAITVPDWAVPIEASSFKRNTFTTTGLSWTLDSTNAAAPITIWVVEVEASTVELAVKATGCVGSVKFTLDKVGDPVQMMFEFKGVFDGIEELTSVLNHADFNDTNPDAVLATTVTAFGKTLDMEKVSIDPGITVGQIVGPERASGVRGYVITGRDPKFTFDPFLADSTMYQDWTGNYMGTFSMTVGSHLTLSAPSIQLTKAYDGGNRNDISINTLSGILARTNDSTDAEFKILQSSES